LRYTAVSVRWIVGPDDGRTVRDVLARAHGDADAVREGRVFVGSRRVLSDGERLRDGDVIEIAAPQVARVEPVRILAQTRDLVAVDKPAGVPTIADHAGAAHALIALVAQQLGVASAELHPTSRLDRDVSGVVMFARTKTAARRLARARTEAAYQRRYVAISAAAPGAEAGTWTAPIGRAKDPRLRAIAGRDAVDAKTHYAIIARTSSAAVLLAFAPVTGRTHQIRVHSAHAGAPLLGDLAYGGKGRVTLDSGRVFDLRRIALHAARIEVPDDRGVPLRVAAPIPADLADTWSVLGGQAAAWELATSCGLG
jgi:23S rRNA pseudouridine1911/1915/1917 synthase